MKSSQVGERDRTAGREHGRRVKKETAGRRERRGRHGEEVESERGRRQETRAEELRESPGPFDSEVSGGRSPACRQLVSLSAHARWHHGDRSRV